MYQNKYRQYTGIIYRNLLFPNQMATQVIKHSYILSRHFKCHELYVLNEFRESSLQAYSGRAFQDLVVLIIMKSVNT